MLSDNDVLVGAGNATNVPVVGAILGVILARTAVGHKRLPTKSFCARGRRLLVFQLRRAQIVKLPQLLSVLQRNEAFLKAKVLRQSD